MIHWVFLATEMFSTLGELRIQRRSVWKSLSDSEYIVRRKAIIEYCSVYFRGF